MEISVNARARVTVFDDNIGQFDPPLYMEVNAYDLRESPLRIADLYKRIAALESRLDTIEKVAACVDSESIRDRHKHVDNEITALRADLSDMSFSSMSHTSSIGGLITAVESMCRRVDGGFAGVMARLEALEGADKVDRPRILALERAAIPERELASTIVQTVCDHVDERFATKKSLAEAIAGVKRTPEPLVRGKRKRTKPDRFS